MKTFKNAIERAGPDADPELIRVLENLEIALAGYDFASDQRELIHYEVTHHEYPPGTKIEYIYALRDPQTLDVCYVGRTDDFDRRKSQHLYWAPFGNDARSEWIRQVRSEGREPIATILERVASSEASAREKFWIALCDGPCLTNHTFTGHSGSLAQRRDSIGREIERREAELRDMKIVHSALKDPRREVCAAYSLAYNDSIPIRTYETFYQTAQHLVAIRASGWLGKSRKAVREQIAAEMAEHAQYMLEQCKKEAASDAQ